MYQVWIDQDLCTGDGLCTDHCPDVFVLLEDGISYVRDPVSTVVGNDPGGSASTVEVPHKLEQQTVDAALACPGECIFIEVSGSGAPADGAADDEDDGDDEHPGGIELPRPGDSFDDLHVGHE